MASMQERIQLKRIPLDAWSTKEKLCLASSVVRSGDQNWMSVSRALKSFGDANRPADWFSQKCCAAQYDALLGPVEKPKRKMRTPDGGAETPQENILKKLTKERMDELQKKMAEMRDAYRKLQEEIDEIQNGNPSDDRIREIWNEIEVERRAEERERTRQTQWIRERDERKARAERSWRPGTLPNITPPGSQPGSSPLLTSLLKSPSPAPTVSQTHLIHITHPSTIPDTVSPSAGAPTLSMLLEKPAGTVTHAAQLPAPPPPIPDTNKNAIIEQIKSDLQQFEKDLIGSMNPQILNPPPLTAITNPTTVSLPASIEERVKSPEKIDIDDIEIKEEDVYVFSDIDLEIPPVSSIHKSSMRGLDKSIFKKDTPLPVLEDLPEPQDFVTEPIIENQPFSIPIPDQRVGDNVQSNQECRVLAADEKVNVEMETLLVKPAEIPIEPDTHTRNAGLVLSESLIAEVPLNTAIAEGVDNEETAKKTELNTSTQLYQATESPNVDISASEGKEKDVNDPNDFKQVEDVANVVESCGSDDTEDAPAMQVAHQERDHSEPDDFSLADQQERAEVKLEPETAEGPLTDENEPSTLMNPSDSTAEVDEPLNTDPELKEASMYSDDHPMEIAREEDKLGRTKRDYSRKKPERDSSELGQIAVEIKTEPLDELIDAVNPVERSLLKAKIKAHKSRSESPSTPIDSLPGSPGTPIIPLLSHTVQPSVKTPSTSSTSSSTEDDKDHRLWKKSVMLVYNRLCGHKNASVFSRPITDEQAPSYSSAVKRPMDLQTIKRHIDCGALRTTNEFHRDVLLMLSNALMYNSSSHHVYSMAQEMHQEAAAQMGMLLQAQAHAAMTVTSTPTRRAHTSSGSSVQPVTKKKRGGDSTSSSTSTSSKKRKEDLND